eukprot:Opistho-1_new@63736
MAQQGQSLLTAVERTLALFKIRVPIIQAPMAGVTTPAMVAAVSNAGGLGSYAAAYVQPNDLRTAIRTIRSLTTRPFAINLFVPEGHPDGALPVSEEATASTPEELAAINNLRAAVGLQPVTNMRSIVPPGFRPSFEDQIAVVREEKVPVLSFTFGALDASIVASLRSNGTLIVGTATTVREAKALEASGVDAIVAQGVEAGGHRGNFMSTPPRDGMIGLMALVPQVVAAVSVPVIAAGGIMNGGGVAASLMLGAGAAQMGTAFLACAESGWPEAQKAAVVAANEGSTVLTRALSGKSARALENAAVRAFAGTRLEGIPREGVQEPGLNDAHVSRMREVFKASMDAGSADRAAVFVGQASSLCRRDGAADIVRAVMGEFDAQMRAVGKAFGH